MAKHKTNMSPTLTEDEELVLKKFLHGMSRIESYRSVFKINISDQTIYTWFKTPKVQNYLRDYETSLSDYNAVTDKVLIEIIKSPMSKDKDKIAAIKLWADIRSRIRSVVKIESEETINIDGLDDETLEKIINQIQNGNNKEEKIS